MSNSGIIIVSRGNSSTQPSAARNLINGSANPEPLNRKVSIMGQVKKLIEDAIERGYAYNTEQGLPTWRRPTNLEYANKFLKERNAKQHWHEDMPDLTGQALADAQQAFDFDNTDEADNMPLWIQLELDLWEGRHGINEQTIWDVAGRGSRE